MRDPKPRSLTGLLAGLCLALLLAGCASKSQAPQPTAVAVLIDVSGSTAGVKDRYLAEYQKILDSLQGGERLFVIPVSAASLVEPVLLDLTFPAKGALTTSFSHSRDMKAVRDRATQQVRDFVSQPRSTRPGSAIIDALEQAHTVLEPFPAQQVVIISDMIEQSELADFSALSEATVAPTLASVASRVPKLAADIYVTGITDGGGDQRLPASQVLAIRSFWDQFFTARGGTVKGYGPTLINYHSRSGS